ncbi:MAG: diacylglycerol kinase family protein [Planctomycetota bacterium]|nr:diacylglycerol kinase family protein [Planctomycetota bacterium]
MHPLILFNPIAGGGRANEASQHLAEVLSRRGFQVVCLPTRAETDDLWLRDALQGRDAVVVVGGDGAVRSVATAAAMLRVPLAQLPFGTENLFARHWGFSREIERMAHTLKARRIAEMDVARANSAPFLIMAGIGFDADVVHDLAKNRKGTISKWSYFKPILRTMIRWRGQPWTISADGGEPFSTAPGTLVVANMREYAARLDPCPDAVCDDQRLDATLMPARTVVGSAVCAVLAWGRWLRVHPNATHSRGSTFVVKSERPFQLQLDGDAMVPSLNDDRIEFSIQPERLLVLNPKES